jgi:uncharacterized membrane protein YcaP (DUF421 family)
MSAALITRTDIVEAARREFHTRDLHDVHSAILDRNGQMSLIRKRPRRDERASAESDAEGYARKAR